MPLSCVVNYVFSASVKEILLPSDYALELSTGYSTRIYPCYLKYGKKYWITDGENHFGSDLPDRITE